MNNEILETHKRLEKNGYAILGPKIFGLNKPMLSALNEQLEKLIVELDEANDQPGALRYHLDNINTIKLIALGLITTYCVARYCIFLKLLS